MISTALATALHRLCEEKIDGLNILRIDSGDADKHSYLLNFWSDPQATSCWKFQFHFDRDEALQCYYKTPDKKGSDPFESIHLDVDGFYENMPGFMELDPVQQAKLVLQELVHYAEQLLQYSPASTDTAPPVAPSAPQQAVATEPAQPARAWSDEEIDYFVRILDAVGPYVCLGDVLDEIADPDEPVTNMLPLGGKRPIGFPRKQSQMDFFKFLQEQQWLVQLSGPGNFEQFFLRLDAVEGVFEFSELVLNYFEKKYPGSPIIETLEKRAGFIP